MHSAAFSRKLVIKKLLRPSVHTLIRPCDEYSYRAGFINVKNELIMHSLDAVTEYT